MAAGGPAFTRDLLAPVGAGASARVLPGGRRKPTRQKPETSALRLLSFMVQQPHQPQLLALRAVPAAGSRQAASPRVRGQGFAGEAGSVVQGPGQTGRSEPSFLPKGFLP